VLAVFLGLILSAREVFRERRIIEKQRYLNLSKFSYINSKITYLFVIAWFQSILFIAISHLMLSVKGMFLMHTLIFFSCEAFGVLIGLILSESHKSLDTIYTRSIPLIILLQLLFGGGIIPLDSLSSKKGYPPLASDVIVCRWAYEAMMVHQFTHNAYTRNFYEIDREISESRINAYYYLPIMKEQVEYCQDRNHPSGDTAANMLEHIQKKLRYYPKQYDLFGYENIDSLTQRSFSDRIANDLSEYLEYLNMQLFSIYHDALQKRNFKEQEISKSLGDRYLQDLQDNYTNQAVIEEVTRSSADPVFDDSVIPPVQLIDQVYQRPESKLGRTLFFLPEKKINQQIIDTVEFNISLIWLINFILYILLLSNLFAIKRIKRVS
jgi:hypothetical protein